MEHHINLVKGARHAMVSCTKWRPIAMFYNRFSKLSLIPRHSLHPPNLLKAWALIISSSIPLDPSDTVIGIVHLMKLQSLCFKGQSWDFFCLCLVFFGEGGSRNRGVIVDLQNSGNQRHTVDFPEFCMIPKFWSWKRTPLMVSKFCGRCIPNRQWSHPPS